MKLGVARPPKKIERNPKSKRTNAIKNRVFPLSSD